MRTLLLPAPQLRQKRIGRWTNPVVFPDPIYLWRNAWVFNKISYSAASSLILLVLFTVLIYLSIWLLRRERRQLEAETAR